MTLRIHTPKEGDVKKQLLLVVLGAMVVLGLFILVASKVEEPKCFATPAQVR